MPSKSYFLINDVTYSNSVGLCVSVEEAECERYEVDA